MITPVYGQSYDIFIGVTISQVRGDVEFYILTHSVHLGFNPTEENGTPPCNGDPTLRSNASTEKNRPNPTMATPP